MSWIKEITYQQAVGKLKKLYDRVKGPNDNVDNIMMAHSLRPHTMQGHMALYKNVLHHRDNTLPKWYLETIGLYVSMLNECNYCVEHHFAGLKRLLNDEEKANSIRKILEKELQAGVLTEKEIAGLRYARRLTLGPSKIKEKFVKQLRQAAFLDDEILELNQVTSYFAYANRTVLGLGVSTDGDTLGLSPGDSDNPENWRHG